MARMWCALINKSWIMPWVNTIVILMISAKEMDLGKKWSFNYSVDHDERYCMNSIYIYCRLAIKCDVSSCPCIHCVIILYSLCNHVLKCSLSLSLFLFFSVVSFYSLTVHYWIKKIMKNKLILHFLIQYPTLFFL